MKLYKKTIILFSVFGLGLNLGCTGMADKVAAATAKQKTEITGIRMKNISSTLKMFRLDCGTYPTTAQGLDALRAKPNSFECKDYAKDGVYLQDSKDALDKDYIYTSDGSTFKIKSSSTNIVITDQD